MKIACRRHICPGCGGAKDFYASACRRCSTVPIADRVLDSSIPEPNSGCWLWIGTLNERPHGSYGALSIKNRPVGAHRAAYTAWRGPIPSGLEVDHKCRNTQCVNPAHLEPVTPVVNKRRGIGSKPACKRGHPFDEANTLVKTDPRTGSDRRYCRQCLALYKTLYPRSNYPRTA